MARPVWLTAVLSLVRRHLEDAEHFYNAVESHCADEMRKLKRKEAQHLPSYWKHEAGYGMTRGELFSAEYAQVETLQSLNRLFAVVLVYGMLDWFLFLLFEDAKRLRLVKSVDIKKNRFLDLKRYARMLKKDLNINLIECQGTYQALNRLRAIRNAVAHHGGWVHSENEKELRQFGFREHGPIELSEGEFRTNKKIVFLTCQTLARQYDEFVRENA